MDERQLEVVIRKNLPSLCVKQFYGVVTSDELSKIQLNDLPVFIIVNILPSYQVGKMGHWTLWFAEGKNIYFF